MIGAFIAGYIVGSGLLEGSGETDRERIERVLNDHKSNWPFGYFKLIWYCIWVTITISMVKLKDE